MRFLMLGLPIKVTDGSWEVESDNRVLKWLGNRLAKRMLQVIQCVEGLTGVHMPIRVVPLNADASNSLLGRTAR